MSRLELGEGQEVHSSCFLSPTQLAISISVARIKNK